MRKQWGEKMNNAFYVIAAIFVVLILVSKFKKGKSCRIGCRPLIKPAPPKKLKTRKEIQEEVRKKIEASNKEQKEKK